jgi:hypothetical protein
MRRTLGALGLAALWLVLAAGPAAADPPGPTNYRSVVTVVETPDGEPVDLDVEVLGGDAYLVLAAPAGATVEVPGYDGEPYVRISPDGLVEVNHRSPTHWFNEDRYGADVPELADADAEPVWRVLFDEGVFAWHEHRIHWMSPGAPPQIDTGARHAQEVFDWEIPVLLDDEPVLIRGELAWHPGPPAWVPAAWLLGAMGVAGVLVRRTRAPLAALVAAVALPAGAAGVAMVVDQPPGADGDPFLVALPGLALAAALVALRVRRREPTELRARLLAAAAAVPLLVWGVLQVGALTRPIVPEPLTGAALRPVVAAALGLGAVALLETARTALGALPDRLEEAGAREEGDVEHGAGDQVDGRRP